MIKNQNPMTAEELKKEIFSEIRPYHVIGFTDDWKNWWHVHDDENVPLNWMLKPQDG